MRPLLVLALLSVPAYSAPRDFPLTWTSRTSAAGQSSLEAWLTPRLVRTDDFFRLDTRVVWTHGVTRTVESQLSLDLDFERTDKTEGVDPKVTSRWRWTTWREATPFAVGGLGRVSLGLNQFEVEARYRRSDGAIRVLHTTSRPRFGPTGEFLGMIGVNVDVTDTRDAHAALAESEAHFRGITNSIEQMIWSTRPDGYHDFYNDR